MESIHERTRYLGNRSKLSLDIVALKLASYHQGCLNLDFVSGVLIALLLLRSLAPAFLLIVYVRQVFVLVFCLFLAFSQHHRNLVEDAV